MLLNTPMHTVFLPPLLPPPGLLNQHTETEAGTHLGIIIFIKPFPAISLILAFCFPGVFKGYKMVTLATNG